MKNFATVILGVIVFAVILLLLSSVYVVHETNQVIITQFGKPVGDPIKTPGLKFKIPFIWKVNYFDRRFLEWDGDPNQVPTKDKRFIWVDTYARWQITDPLLFFQRLRDETGAQSRLDDILDGETRNAIANHTVIEVVRNTNREFTEVEELGGAQEDRERFKEIKFGRGQLAQEVLRNASMRTADLGIEILDFRFKRINYVREVQEKVYVRMISERLRIAEQFRSEGAGEAARIAGEKERQLKEITSDAYRQAQEIKGRADAEAADLYAAAYTKDPEFYQFLKTMEIYRETFDENTVLLLTTAGEFLRYLGKAK